MAHAIEQEQALEPHVAVAARPTSTPKTLQGVAETEGGMFRSMRHRNYRLLFIGTLFASSGLWLQQVTINYLVFALSGSSLVVGLASGARSVPLF